jgi:hypothetical protein
MQMDALAMEDMVQRVGYDDFNESLCSKEGVHRLLNRLRVTKQVRAACYIGSRQC